MRTKNKVILLTGLCAGLLLLAAACTLVDPSTPAPTHSIQGIVWQWVSVTEKPTNTTTTISNPENYTLIFNADNTFTGTADCNAISGTYSQENGFSITLGPSTMAFCGEASLDQQYLD